MAEVVDGGRWRSVAEVGGGLAIGVSGGCWWRSVEVGDGIRWR